MKELIDRLVNGPERLRAATALIDAGDGGEDLSPATDALAAALGDADPAVRKEVVWALYVLARQGHPLGAARAALEQQPEGNATIGLALDDLRQGRVDETLARMVPETSANAQFGVANALADFAERTQDRKLAERLLGQLPFGIVAPMLSNGVAASILGSIQRTGKSFVASVCGELASSTDDPLKQAPLYGVMMKVNERLPR